MKLRTLALFGIAVGSTAGADTAVYDIGPNNAKETAEAIDAALHSQCGRSGSDVAGTYNCIARLLPNGQLLVEAPTASQAIRCSTP